MVHRQYKSTEMQLFNLQMVPLCLVGLIQRVHDIWLGLWPRWHPQMQLPCVSTLNTFPVWYLMNSATRWSQNRLMQSLPRKRTFVSKTGLVWEIQTNLTLKSERTNFRTKLSLPFNLLMISVNEPSIFYYSLFWGKSGQIIRFNLFSFVLQFNLPFWVLLISF